MTLNEYQTHAMSTCLPQCRNLVYLTLKLNGEAGEVAEKIGKSIRDQSLPDKIQVARELGDALWYLAVSANELGYTLQQIAEMNVCKLADRKQRGVIQGSGDNR